MKDPRAIMAARNNADWYAMMFAIHGLNYRRSRIAFLALDNPPPYHSRMTTLDPEAGTDLLELVSQNMDRPRFGIKDSFDCLGLAEKGLKELFTAEWFYANKIRPGDTSKWVRIESTEDLLLWEAAWKDGGSPSEQRQFPNAILEREDVAIWGRRISSGFDAGVVANFSTDCVGLSNCFGEDAYPSAAALCAELGRGLPIVGYDRDDNLDAALSVGFESTGRLRIWVK